MLCTQKKKKMLLGALVTIRGGCLASLPLSLLTKIAAPQANNYGQHLEYFNAICWRWRCQGEHVNNILLFMEFAQLAYFPLTPKYCQHFLLVALINVPLAFSHIAKTYRANSWYIFLFDLLFYLSFQLELFRLIDCLSLSRISRLKCDVERQLLTPALHGEIRINTYANLAGHAKRVQWTFKSYLKRKQVWLKLNALNENGEWVGESGVRVNTRIA